MTATIFIIETNAVDAQDQATDPVRSCQQRATECAGWPLRVISRTALPQAQPVAVIFCLVDPVGTYGHDLAAREGKTRTQ